MGKIIGILGGAMATALVIVTGLIYFYGPSGAFRLDHVLLAPDSIAELSYFEHNHRFQFDKIEFLHRSASAGISHHEVTMQGYAAFYDQIAADYSMKDSDGSLSELFQGAHTSSLMLTVRPEAGGAGTNLRSFQEVHLIQDYYRVELRMDGVLQWAYFHHPGVLEKALDTLSEVQ